MSIKIKLPDGETITHNISISKPTTFKQLKEEIKHRLTNTSPFIFTLNDMELKNNNKINENGIKNRTLQIIYKNQSSKSNSSTSASSISSSINRSSSSAAGGKKVLSTKNEYSNILKYLRNIYHGNNINTQKNKDYLKMIVESLYSNKKISNEMRSKLYKDILNIHKVINSKVINSKVINSKEKNNNIYSSISLNLINMHKKGESKEFLQTTVNSYYTNTNKNSIKISSRIKDELMHFINVLYTPNI